MMKKSNEQQSNIFSISNRTTSCKSSTSQLQLAFLSAINLNGSNTLSRNISSSFRGGTRIVPFSKLEMCNIDLASPSSLSTTTSRDNRQRQTDSLFEKKKNNSMKDFNNRPNSSSSQYIEHVVTGVDTLTSIALSYGVSKAHLRRANRLSSDDIWFKKSILVPISSSMSTKNVRRTSDMLIESLCSSRSGSMSSVSSEKLIQTEKLNGSISSDRLKKSTSGDDRMNKRNLNAEEAQKVVAITKLTDFPSELARKQLRRCDGDIQRALKVAEWVMRIVRLNVEDEMSPKEAVAYLEMYDYDISNAEYHMETDAEWARKYHQTQSTGKSKNIRNSGSIDEMDYLLHSPPWHGRSKLAAGDELSYMLSCRDRTLSSNSILGSFGTPSSVPIVSTMTSRIQTERPISLRNRIHTEPSSERESSEREIALTSIASSEIKSFISERIDDGIKTSSSENQTDLMNDNVSLASKLNIANYLQRAFVPTCEENKKRQ